MFSKEFSIEEAHKNIKTLDYYFFIENFDKGVRENFEINVVCRFPFTNILSFLILIPRRF